MGCINSDFINMQFITHNKYSLLWYSTEILALFFFFYTLSYQFVRRKQSHQGTDAGLIFLPLSNFCAILGSKLRYLSRSGVQFFSSLSLYRPFHLRWLHGFLSCRNRFPCVRKNKQTNKQLVRRWSRNEGRRERCLHAFSTASNMTKHISGKH